MREFKATSLNEGLVLAESKKWAKNIRAVKEGYKKTFGKEVPANILATTAQVLENTDRMMRAMNETTRVSNLGNFIDYGLGVITAVMPALVANEIVSVQPLKARTGNIFYLSYNFGSTKSGATAGEAMISPFTGAANYPDYTSEVVNNEVLGTLSTSATSFEANLSYLPVVAGKVEISVGTEALVDDGAGNLVVKGGSTISNFTSGTIDYTTGKIAITLSAAMATETDLVAAYEFQYGNQNVRSANIPEVDVELASVPISTVARSLRARWIFDAGFELQETHGINIESELAAAMAAEVRHEIDMEIMNDLYVQASAGNTLFTWSRTPATGVAFVDHKDTFVDTLIAMTNAIFGDTKRAEGNYIIAGLNACSIIESLAGRFVPDNNALKAGPHVIGTLNGRWKVIKNPFYGADEFLVGYKGDSYLEGNYVYAPYLPLYTSPTVMLDDFINRKGVRTRYGKKMLNSKFFAKGKITV